jgi:putative endonuclease
LGIQTAHAIPGLLRRAAPRNDAAERYSAAMDKEPCVYIMANRRNGTLYCGVTSNISERAWQHRTGAMAGFTRRYGCKLLVFVERHLTMSEAIAREKQIKAGSRADKLRLIESANPQWHDLFETLTP